MAKKKKPKPKPTIVPKSARKRANPSPPAEKPNKKPSALKKPAAPAATKTAPAVAGLTAAKAAFERFGEGIRKKLSPHGVIGLSYGCRYKDGKKTDEMTIRLHVKSQADKDRLKEQAQAIGFKKTYGGVGTDIVVWDFHASAAQPNGTALTFSLPNGQSSLATLGTRVVVDDVGTAKGMWITTGHGVSPTLVPFAGTRDVFANGSLIGSIAGTDVFVDQHVDIAFVTPSAPISKAPTTRTMVGITSKDIGKKVAMIGAASGSKVGVIDGIYDGDVSYNDETIFMPVENHFLVTGTDGAKFAKAGDSGAIVTFQEHKKILVGMVRAASKSTGVAVVSQIAAAPEMSREFDV